MFRLRAPRIYRYALGAAAVLLAAFAASGPVRRAIEGAPSRESSAVVRSLEPLSDTAFAKLITRISEPGGFFDSDNLVSNETGYLHPIPRMQKIGVEGGAYIGVGPDQNYSYIAHVRPAIAFMLDIRRDAALQHLLYKSLMLESRNRLEYLALLLARPVPGDVLDWSDRSIDDIVGYLDGVSMRSDLFAANLARVKERLQGMPHEVTPFELLNVEKIYGEFAHWGLDLQYSSLNRPSRRSYPTLRSLILQHDTRGKQVGYLASEELFQVVRSLHANNLIVPVTGNLAGGHAVREIGEFLRERGLTVSVFYTSNVEFYLSREEGSFYDFAENVTRLPRDRRSVIIRSYFNNGGFRISAPSGSSPAFSVQMLSLMNAFVKEFEQGGYRSYRDVVTKHILPLD